MTMVGIKVFAQPTSVPLKTCQIYNAVTRARYEIWMTLINNTISLMNVGNFKSLQQSVHAVKLLGLPSAIIILNSQKMQSK